MTKLEKSRVDKRRRDKVEFDMPAVGEPIEKYHNGLNLELLERGRLDFIKYQESVKGQLTQDQFDLVRSCSLTEDNLMTTSDKLHAGNVETKFLLLKRRYYVDADGIVRDYKCSDTVVCEPELMFDLIMCGHLKNGHLHWRRLHSYLRHNYANTTRAFAQICVKYCSQCNPEEELRPYKKFRHTNIYSGLLPLERVHVEIISPFSEAIEGTYSHVLFFRDYYSRFVWMQPLKGDDVRDITKGLLATLLLLPRIPIFIETSTIDRQDLFEACEDVAGQYSLYIGLGMSQSSTFQKNGVERLRYLLQRNEEQCLRSWYMCLKYGATNHNLNYNARILGVPGNLLHSTVCDYGRQFELKREDLIEKLFARNVVEIKVSGRRRGIIYLEDETSAFKMPDEEYISAENETDMNDDDLGFGSATRLTTPLTSPGRTPSRTPNRTPGRTPGRTPNEVRKVQGGELENLGAENQKVDDVDSTGTSSELSGPAQKYYPGNSRSTTYTEASNNDFSVEI
ncbi:replication fork barrier binding protein FOB1 [Lachancea thermotolerans CBS 6340]|uniref:KLTH0G13684p n=1 Tax=Lachancea thermotolerans (strain ATCC 56472 / CBS 6340 / NRRL Y-8284) TaxID=559295 RepID=C5DN29_LACTC|nr:KLTH0G13684p [Lachancea thermotolerans CBS 6340]CAR25190.1 KLTH0G13684p [Lachancea thermotolerans CBS 6340]